MNDYYNTLNKEIKNYFEVLVDEFPDWLYEYINTKKLLSQKYISVTCGTIYSNLFESKFFYSSLDHSVAVALIVWNFTHNKKQTLAGLFHDIATPAFKHCVDFLNGDYMKQESTEDLTTEMIKNSEDIMKLLNRDNIHISDVDDYHIYPIADNDTPKLSSDRLEYSLSNALFTYRLLDLDSIRKIYDDIVIQKNEQNESELGFKTKEIAEFFVKVTSNLSIKYRENKTRYSMQLIADIIKKLNDENMILKKDLYELKESEIINIIESSKYKDVFDMWKNAKEISSSKYEPKGVYYVHHGAKIRYINPLFNGKRIAECSNLANEMIQENLNYDMNDFVYLNFELK